MRGSLVQAKAPAAYRQPETNLNADRLPFWRELLFVFARSTVKVRCVAELLSGAKQTVDDERIQYEHRTKKFRDVVAFGVVDETSGRNGSIALGHR